jgi:sporulation protein YlmC with PRC-barrel domain
MIRKALIATATAVALSASTVSMAAAQTTQPIEFIDQQKSTEWLTSNLVGVAVENAAGEQLGDVNDLVISGNGEVVGAVIGVGGILGMGEKNVGVPYNSIKTMTKDEETVVILSTTKEELEAAPDYTNREGQPLSISKRLKDSAAESYSDAKDKATEVYGDAKEKASETYVDAKKKVVGEETKTQ